MNCRSWFSFNFWQSTTHQSCCWSSHPGVPSPYLVVTPVRWRCLQIDWQSTKLWVILEISHPALKPTPAIPLLILYNSSGKTSFTHRKPSLSASYLPTACWEWIGRYQSQFPAEFLLRHRAKLFTEAPDLNSSDEDYETQASFYPPPSPNISATPNLLRLAQTVQDAQDQAAADSLLAPASPTLAKLLGITYHSNALNNTGQPQIGNGVRRTLQRSKSSSKGLFGNREVQMVRKGSEVPESLGMASNKPVVKAKARTNKRKQASPKSRFASYAIDQELNIFWSFRIGRKRANIDDGNSGQAKSLSSTFCASLWSQHWHSTIHLWTIGSSIQTWRSSTKWLLPIHTGREFESIGTWNTSNWSEPRTGWDGRNTRIALRYRSGVRQSPGV